jgi:MSHA pilin protein MshD
MSTERRRSRGFSLIELIVFIVVVGVGLAGVLAVLNFTVRNSADPMLRKNMLSIAETLMEEVQLQPFTYCDPTDPNAATANTATLVAGDPTGNFCAATVEVAGPEGAQVRVSTIVPFNNVSDYAGTVLASPIGDVSGTFAAPAGYAATIAVLPDAGLGGIASAACAGAAACPAMNVVRIVVTVTVGAEALVLEGYRARYAPNSL